MTAPSIEFNNVYRHFDSNEVLRGMSLEVKPGEIYALLGRNGCGKSTAIRTLMGFIQPTHGVASLLSVDSQKLTPEHRGRIGYVSEGHRLYSTMRVSDAIAFENGTRPNFRLDEAKKAVARCGLPLRSYIGILSRGQKAQLSLILAASGKPEVLIFDDPALGLDVVMRREFLDAMIDILSDQGASVLFSSHVMTDVERIADRVGILHNGRMIVDATLDDLKRRVERRSLQGSADPDLLRSPSILNIRARRQGMDITFLDLDRETEARFQASGNLSEAQSLNLEELFLDLVTESGPSSLLSEPVGTLS